MTLNIQFMPEGWLKEIDQIRENCNAANLLKDAGAILRADIESIFWGEGQSVWAPLSPRRLSERADGGLWGGPDPVKLIDTEGLIISWTQPGGDHVEIIDSDSITVGTNLFYAGLQQYGGINEEGFEVPARPVWFRESALYDIADSVVVNLSGE